MWWARCSAPRNPRLLSPCDPGGAVRNSSRLLPYAASQFSRYQTATRFFTSGSVTTTHPQPCWLPPDGPRMAALSTDHRTSSGIGSGARYRREGVECSASMRGRDSGVMHDLQSCSSEETSGPRRDGPRSECSSPDLGRAHERGPDRPVTSDDHPVDSEVGGLRGIGGEHERALHPDVEKDL